MPWAVLAPHLPGPLFPLGGGPPSTSLRVSDLSALSPGHPCLFLVTITSLWADFPGVVLGCPHVPVRGLRAGGWGRHWPAQVSDKHTEQPSSHSTWVSGGRAWPSEPDPLHRSAHGSALGHLPVWASQIWALSGAAWPVGPSLPGRPPGRLAARALAPLGVQGGLGVGGVLPSVCTQSQAAPGLSPAEGTSWPVQPGRAWPTPRWPRQRYADPHPAPLSRVVFQVSLLKLAAVESWLCLALRLGHLTCVPHSSPTWMPLLSDVSSAPWEQPSLLHHP